MGDPKFEQNRNKFRRVYGYGGQHPPNIVTYTDSFTGLQHQRDFNQIIRDRDMFRIGAQTITGAVAPGLPVAEYAENIVTLQAYSLIGPPVPIPGPVETLTVIFPITFTHPPIVTLEIPSGSAAGWVNPFILDIQTTYFVLGVSAPATGTIHYKAINLEAPNLYPALVTRAPLFPSTVVTASAGAVVVPGTTNVTMSFAALGPSIVPTEFTFTADEIGNSQADTYISGTILGITSASAELSTYLSGTIDYIALT